MNQINGIWITWEVQRRNHGISASLDYPLYEIESKGIRLKRYFASIAKTFTVLTTDKPDVVVAQNPSIILSITVILLQKFLNYKIIIDAHNGGLFPFEGRSLFLLSIAKWIQRKSDLTLVTNEEMKAVVESNGGSAFVLPDKIPNVPVPTSPKKVLNGQGSIAFICTFSSDEPYQNVIEAARLLNPNIYVHITGKYKGKVNLSDLPHNVKMRGYLAEIDYWSLLHSVDVVMDLTLREGCLVCGAYEAIAINTPLILSNTKATKKYFNDGCVYVDPSPEGIANGVTYALSNLVRLEDGVKRLKSGLQDNWNDRLILLQRYIQSWY